MNLFDWIKNLFTRQQTKRSGQTWGVVVRKGNAFPRNYHHSPKTFRGMTKDEATERAEVINRQLMEVGL